MNCKMEENSRLYDVLSVLEDGYTTGNFEGLFPFVAQDCFSICFPNHISIVELPFSASFH